MDETTFAQKVIRYFSTIEARTPLAHPVSQPVEQFGNDADGKTGFYIRCRIFVSPRKLEQVGAQPVRPSASERDVLDVVDGIASAWVSSERVLELVKDRGTSALVTVKCAGDGEMGDLTTGDGQMASFAHALLRHNLQGQRDFRELCSSLLEPIHEIGKFQGGVEAWKTAQDAENDVEMVRILAGTFRDVAPMFAEAISRVGVKGASAGDGTPAGTTLHHLNEAAANLTCIVPHFGKHGAAAVDARVQLAVRELRDKLILAAEQVDEMMADSAKTDG